MASPHVRLRYQDGGTIEGADRVSRETVWWSGSRRSADAIINPLKPEADARGKDSDRNDGFIRGANQHTQDSVVGSQYRLMAAPNWRYMSTLNKAYDEQWAEDFTSYVEDRFNLLGDSDAHWLDAMRVGTFTSLIRQAISMYFQTGEYLATVEYIDDPSRPINTAIQPVNPDRLCNEFNLPDTRYLRRGIVRDLRGQPIAYQFRMGDIGDIYPDSMMLTWRTVEAQWPWGRKKVIHLYEQDTVDQSRGVGNIVSVLKNIRMFRKYSDVKLQNAVIQATYAASLESELPKDAIAAALGAGGGDADKALLQVYRAHMGALGHFMEDANNVRIDGAMIPHLFPGTKLAMTPVKPGSFDDTTLEFSLLRHICAGLGISYEAFSRDFSKSNYSSVRAALGVQGQAMANKKRAIADGAANHIYALVLEEDITRPDVPVPLPRGQTWQVFYAPLAKEALTRAQWIGSGAGQIDEVRETEAARDRVRSGFSTWQQECARLGRDWREVFEGQARERKAAEKLGISFDLSSRGNAPVDTASDVGVGSPNAATTPANSNAPQGGQ